MGGVVKWPNRLRWLAHGVTVSRLGASRGRWLYHGLTKSRAKIRKKFFEPKQGSFSNFRYNEKKGKTMNGPLAYFMTWTVYGTHLPGSEKWWRNRSEISLPPRPKLEEWCRKQLRHPVFTLSVDERQVVKSTVEIHANFRNWKLWAMNARTNHVHVVISAQSDLWDVIRDQLKAYCTRDLRLDFSRWRGRPVWTKGGDCEFIDTMDELENVINYVLYGQD